MTRHRFWSIVSSGGLALLFATTGCASDPCADLPRPSQTDIARSNQGEEVERTVGDTQCEWDYGQWVEDD